MTRAIALALAMLSLSGCGLAMGGLTTAGSAEVEAKHTGGRCPDLTAQGSINLNGVSVVCSYNPTTGAYLESATIASADPAAALAQAAQAQAAQLALVTQILAKILPLLPALATPLPPP